VSEINGLNDLKLNITAQLFPDFQFASN